MTSRFVSDAPTVVCVLSFVGFRAVAGTLPFPVLLLLMAYLMLLGPCCCRHTFCILRFAVVGVTSVVGVPAMAGASSIFSIHAGVAVSAVARVLLLFTFLLFMVFSPFLVYLIG